MKRLVAALAGAGLLLAGAPLLYSAPDLDLPFLQEKVQRDPQDFFAWNKLGDHYLSLLRVSGNLKWLAKAADAADASLKAVHTAFNAAGLGVQGRVELAQHRFRKALATGHALAEMQPDRVGGLVLICDAAFELGDYATAEQSLHEAVKMDEELSIGSESREAKLEFIHGRLKEAKEHFERALTMANKETVPPETVAWCLVQLGELAFQQGQWEEAEKRYLAAADALPNWYVTEEHVAELRGAQGHYDEAQAAYEKLVARVPRPELLQALGDLLFFGGQPDAARQWHEKARALYESSLARGEMLYLHHASGFYADSVKEPAKALETAQKDIAERQSVQAWDALAWAQEASGDVNAAAESIKKALATGIQDSHILYHAAMILISSGDVAGGKAALKHCVEINPRYQTFHVHR